MIRLVIIFFSSVLVAFSYNMFLLPHHILSSGVSGIAMMLGLLTPWNTGIINLVLNIPIFVVGWMKLGRKFMLYSLLSMVVTSLALLYIPIYPIANDPILSSVFGGALVGIAGGLIFRSAASTGGFDIIGLLLTRKQDLPLGSILFAMNAVVIAVAGYFFKWDVALYTMLSIFVTGKVVDTVYTNNLKLTLMIISSKGDEIKDKLLAKFVRGITVTDGEGAYTKEKRRILFMVITRYELADIKKIIKETDSKAFVNIMETAQVMGYFRRD